MKSSGLPRAQQPRFILQRQRRDAWLHRQRRAAATAASDDFSAIFGFGSKTAPASSVSSATRNTCDRRSPVSATLTTSATQRLQHLRRSRHQPHLRRHSHRLRYDIGDISKPLQMQHFQRQLQRIFNSIHRQHQPQEQLRSEFVNDCWASFSLKRDITTGTCAHRRGGIQSSTRTRFCLPCSSSSALAGGFHLFTKQHTHQATSDDNSGLAVAAQLRQLAPSNACSCHFIIEPRPLAYALTRQCSTDFNSFRRPTWASESNFRVSRRSMSASACAATLTAWRPTSKPAVSTCTRIAGITAGAAPALFINISGIRFCRRPCSSDIFVSAQSDRSMIEMVTRSSQFIKLAASSSATPAASTCNALALSITLSTAFSLCDSHDTLAVQQYACKFPIPSTTSFQHSISNRARALRLQQLGNTRWATGHL